jgi:hypothetical protein
MAHAAQYEKPAEEYTEIGVRIQDSGFRSQESEEKLALSEALVLPWVLFCKFSEQQGSSSPTFILDHSHTGRHDALLTPDF